MEKGGANNNLIRIASILGVVAIVFGFLAVIVVLFRWKIKDRKGITSYRSNEVAIGFPFLIIQEVLLIIIHPIHILLLAVNSRDNMILETHNTEMKTNVSTSALVIHNINSACEPRKK